MSPNVSDVSTAEFVDKVIERSRDVPVVVDFWAEWCGPCKVLGPTLERLAAEGGGAWELAKVDVDSNQQLAMQFGVQGIPTVVGFRDGRPVARFTGAVPEGQVRQFLETLLPSELDLATRRAETLLDSGDEAGAEEALRSVLAQDPSHRDAGTAMAALLIDRNEAEAALEVLARLAPDETVRRLQAAARMSGGGDLEELERAAADGDPRATLAYARGLAGAGRVDEALPLLIELVALREEEVSEEARVAAVDLFELLGPDHPLSSEYRRKLASALF